MSYGNLVARVCGLIDDIVILQVVKNERMPLQVWMIYVLMDWFLHLGFNLRVIPVVDTGGGLRGLGPTLRNIVPFLVS